MTSDRPGSEHVTIFCLMRPKADQAETLLDSLLALVQPTRAEAGCLAYDVYEEADGSLVLFETWRSGEESAAHQQQPAIKDLFGDRLQDLLAQDMSVHYGVLRSPAA
jgi:quinol monooxygenase YgiN